MDNSTLHKRNTLEEASDLSVWIEPLRITHLNTARKTAPKWLTSQRAPAIFFSLIEKWRVVKRLDQTFRASRRYVFEDVLVYVVLRDARITLKRSKGRRWRRHSADQWENKQISNLLGQHRDSHRQCWVEGRVSWSMDCRNSKRPELAYMRKHFPFGVVKQYFNSVQSPTVIALQCE